MRVGYTQLRIEEMFQGAKKPGFHGAFMSPNRERREQVWRRWKESIAWYGEGVLHDTAKRVSRFSNGSTVSFCYPEQMVQPKSEEQPFTIVDEIVKGPEHSVKTCASAEEVMKMFEDPKPLRKLDYWDEFFREHFPGEHIYSCPASDQTPHVVVKIYSEKELQRLQRLLFDRYISFALLTVTDDQARFAAENFFKDLDLEYTGQRAFFGLDNFGAWFGACAIMGRAFEHTPVAIFFNSKKMDPRAFKEALHIAAPGRGCSLRPLNIFVEPRGVWGI